MTGKGLALGWLAVGLSALAAMGSACSGHAPEFGGTSDSGGPDGVGTAFAPEGGADGAGAGDAQSDAPFHLTDASAGSSGGGGPMLTTSGKVDILIDIDNSASMGDKQAYLRAAIPDLIDGLVNPSCVDATTGAYVGASVDGVCSKGVLEYPPVRDMHIALITSSLGPRGGDACNAAAFAQPPFSNVLAHNDDQAHLVNRTLTYADGGASAVEGTLADAAPTPADEFLYWFPGAAAQDGGVSTDGGAEAGVGTPLLTTQRVEGDLAQLVEGAGVFGCGIESQLESWYRFLVQPDPYASIAVSAGTQASWVGLDTTILQQRHDFLLLSDENDSEIDVRALGGQAFHWMAGAFYPPRGTAACATNPGSASCQSCAMGTNSSTDSNCVAGQTYTALSDWGYDLNLRHVHMKAKYGVDPQYPITRYLTGLTSQSVPDRNGEYPQGATSYVGNLDCTNPLFAAALPDGRSVSGTADGGADAGAYDPVALCNLPKGNRPPGFVFYTHIGGVPSSLLHYSPGNVTASTLTGADWTLILGNDPLNYDYTGIDPHMIESYQPRAGVSAPGSANNADAVNGHDWITNSGTGHILQVDREYACTFPLVDSTGTPSSRDCTLPQNSNFCDCPHMAGTLTLQQLPPICDQTTQTLQVGAKAYPTIRELYLAKMLGPQGIVASICPQHVAESTPGDPLWGYRPAIGILISRLAPVIGHPIQ